MPTDVVAPPLAWQFDPILSRYRDTATGRFISSQQVTQLRNDFLDVGAARVATLAEQVSTGKITLGAWETAMREQIKTTLGVEYVFGHGGLNQMTPADWDALSDLVARQYRYLSDFAQAIEDGTLSAAQIAARAYMYLGAGIGAYERGAAAASEVDLPEYPGDSCLGLTACRCSWQVSMAEDGSVEAYWICEDDLASCEPCITNGQEWNPLVL